VQTPQPVEPRLRGPRPEYPQLPIDPPGRDSALTPRADHAELLQRARTEEKVGAAQPVEIAPLFVFLASSESRSVTGEVYGATGGQTPF